jgi:DNA topoisomerase II
MTQSNATNGKGTKKKANAKNKTKTKTKTKSGSKNSKNAKVVKTRKVIKPATIEDAYKHKTHHQHILDIPDSYIGSTKSTDATLYVINPDYDEEEDSMPLIVESEIKYIPGFFKIFDEIIVNARDHSVKDKTCKNIRVTLDRETGRITVWNDGNGIPIAYHKGEKMYLPEMLFGHLLTSGNYDQEGKTVGGKNGYGAKLANIYSKEFTIHTIGYNDLAKTKKSKKVEYRQVFTNNMKTIGNPVLNGQEIDVEKVKPQIEKKGDLSILNKQISQNTKTFAEFSYLPDYERFGMTGLTSDMYNLLMKRCYDIAACTISAGVKVFVNDEEIKCKDFNTYVRMFYAKKTDDGKNNPIKVVHEKVNSRWEIAIGFGRDTNEGDRYISFVNGISTFHGGYHLDHVVNNVSKKVVEYITSQKEHKDLRIDTKTVKQYLTFFVNGVVEDPAFDSQTKTKLDSKIADWCIHKPKCKDVRCNFSEEFIDKLCNTGLMKAVVEMSEFKQSKELTKGEKGKVGRVTDIPKLIDAEQAGKRNSAKTSLFLTEGDSAKAFAVSGLGVIGSKFYGVFPLRGKLLNVRNASIKQIAKCAEFKNLKAILGLRQGKKYQNVAELRYGSIIILTDQDPDGSHIKGLVINMFEYFWPELLQMNGFIKAYNTYIVKAWKKTDKKKKNVKMFYTIPEFDAWKDKLDMSKWAYKYYKGLGTSDEKEARESFQDFEGNLVEFKWENPSDNNEAELDESELLKLKAKLEAKSEVKVEKEAKDSKTKGDEENESNSDDTEISEHSPETDDMEDSEPEEDEEFAYVKSKSHNAIVKAFDESRANARKVWLKAYRPEDAIQYRRGMGHITYSDFVDKDLRIFSTEDNVRSICSMLDGLKPSQRMILYGCFKRGRNSGESKVAQLGAYVAEHTDYHHGETSLFGAIIGMAQNFPGANNINLLQPIGNFGYRRQGGKEAASPRYIFTALSPITNTIFRQEDDEILTYNDVDGKRVEPINYEPILPMVLINGGEGIGTGYAFKVPPYNPKDVILNIKRLIKGQEPMEMVPWYNGYKNNAGTKVLGPNKYEYYGLYDIKGKNVRITEIPIYNGWIEPYEQKMMDKLSTAKDDGKKVLNISNNVMNNAIDMTLTFRGNELQTLYKRNGINKFLNMRKKMSYNSMYLFDEDQVIRKYDGATDILRQFYTHRLEVYNTRKEYWLKKLLNDLNIYKYKVKFIKEFLADTIQVARVSSTRVIEQFEEKDESEPLGTRYPRLTGDHRKSDSERSYRYLTDMSILSLTTDKLAELERKMQECHVEYDDYLKTPIEDIWMRELDEFSKVYNQFLKDWKDDNEYNNFADPNAKGKGKKKVTRATKAKGKTASKSSTSKSGASKAPAKSQAKPKARAKPKGKSTVAVKRARVTKAKAAGQIITTGKDGKAKKASA